MDSIRIASQGGADSPHRRDALRWSIDRLRAVGIEDAVLESELLLAAACGIERVEILAHPITLIGPESWIKLQEMVGRRAGREPLPYILGKQPFLDFEVYVSPAVLIPRPETELLVQIAVDLLPPVGGPVPPLVVDLGTGSGIIAIGIARSRHDVQVLAVDIKDDALAIAASNIDRLGLSHRISLSNGDLFQAVDPDLRGRVSVVASNPPYIPSGEIPALQPEIVRFEPPTALDGGHSGLDVIRQIVLEARLWIEPGGGLAMEIGEGQSATVVQMLLDLAYEQIVVYPDLAGIPRVVACHTSRQTAYSTD